ncbi:MAG: Stk1 family PASTA domain-containing Ser/Thr kinase [Sporomusaceae bacterium]|jgi:serine/threonine-protein kinase|nr:Stk1 family PASTA domain-containing Ser/Thr kinase [Sporomusaceae bacterium]
MINNFVLDNRYTIIERVGGGGMADVYRAHDKLLDRSVAVKVLKGQFVDDGAFVDNFRLEALAAARLSHPNIVNIYDVGFEKDVYYIIMEYISGETLKDKIDREAPFTQNESIRIAFEIAEALEHAHQNNLVHCDIKPHNILLTRSGRVKVTDFGIARAVTSNTINEADTILGSVHYFSPEQAQGSAVSAKSDIYSLGIVLYEMLSGKLPFACDTPIGIALKHIQEDATPLRELNRQILPLIEAIVLKAMAKEPRERFENIGEMISDLKMAQNYLRDNLTRRYQNTEEIDFSATMPQERIDKNSLPKYTPSQLKQSLNTRNEGAPVTSKRKKFFLPGLLFLLLISAAAAFLGFGNIGALREVAVPDVVGKQADIAERQLIESGLTVAISDTYDEKTPSGSVISQQPEPGSIVKEGRLISLIVSKGGEIVTVPALSGFNRANAEVQITNASLTLGKVAEEYSEQVQKDFIIGQNPLPAAQAPKGSAVDIVISKGPVPTKFDLPDLTGLSISAAVAKLDSLKLKLGTVTETETSSSAPGIVVNQNPPALSQVEEGNFIGLIVTKAPDVTRPNPNLGQRKQALVQVVIPGDSGRDQVLKIVVTDNNGRRVVYEENHPAGSRVEQTIEGVGQVRVQVYINNRLLQEQIL